MNIKVKNVKSKHTLILSKMNGKKMGYIHCDTVTKLYRGIKVISELEFTVNKYYGAENTYNPLYNELQNERIIDLDDEESFVIKNVKKIGNNKKQVTAYSREKKLARISLELNDITLTLKTPYSDIKGCYSLDELLYEYTGWRLGYISDEVLYKKNETILDILNGTQATLTTEEKLRYQESVTSNWYDFINTEISEQFECFPVFDSYNKLINLYSDGELGGKLQLLLSYDNYLKSHEVVSDTDEIVTILTLKGNEDLTIIEENPTGEDFLENYDYFIKREEMSQELIIALNTYKDMVRKRTEQWYSLREIKSNKSNNMQKKKVDLLFVYKRITALETIINSSTNDGYKAQIAEQLAGLNSQRVSLETEINNLQTEINLITESIDNINKLCKKKTATDDNGLLIFNQKLLDELKEFVFQDSYENDSITDSTTLYKIGERELKKRIYPNITWNIDTVNFMSKIIDNGFRQHWNGELSLGDTILLRDDEGIVTPVYFVGYTQSFKKGEESIELELSNIKDSNDFSLSIGERLTMAKKAYRIVKSNQSSINKLNKNRVGLQYDKINKEIM